MSVLVGGWRWKAQCQWQHPEVNVPTGVFTPTDIDNMLCGRRQLLDYSLWSLTRLLQWMAYVAAFMHFITTAIGVVHYGRFQSDPLESAMTWFRSDNRPFSSENSRAVNILPHNSRTIIHSEKSSTNANIKSTIGFPMSHQPRSCITPDFPKWSSDTQICCYLFAEIWTKHHYK